MENATQRSITAQVRAKAITTEVARFARAVAEVSGVGSIIAIEAAERLIEGGQLVTAGQISRNYRCGGITHDLVNAAIESI